MTITARRLIALALAHGLDPRRIWDMNLLEFAAAIEDARRRRGN